MNKSSALLLIGLIVISNASQFRHNTVRKAFLQTKTDAAIGIINDIFDESNDESILLPPEDLVPNYTVVAANGGVPLTSGAPSRSPSFPATQTPNSSSNLSYNCNNGKCDSAWEMKKNEILKSSPLCSVKKR